MRISDWSSDVCSSDLQGDKITLLDRQFDAMQHLDALLAALVHLGQAMDFDQRAHGFLSITLLPSRNAGGGDNATTSPSKSEEHTSELQSLMRISSAVLCLKKKTLQQAKYTTFTIDTTTHTTR